MYKTEACPLRRMIWSHHNIVATCSFDYKIYTMKKYILLSLSLLALVFISCKKNDTPQPEAIAFIKPTTTSVSVSAGSTVNLQAQLTVTDKIDKLEVFEKIGSNAQTMITSKGYSNSTNTDVYIDTYIVPAGTPPGTIITLTIILYQKSLITEFARKTLTITVN